MLLYVHRNLRTLRDEEPRTTASSFTQLLSSEMTMFKFSVAVAYSYNLSLRERERGREREGEGERERALASTETVRTVRDGEPRTTTSSFTQLLSSEITMFEFIVVLCPQRQRKQCCFTSTDSGTGSPEWPPRLSHSS